LRLRVFLEWRHTPWIQHPPPVQHPDTVDVRCALHDKDYVQLGVDKPCEYYQLLKSTMCH